MHVISLFLISHVFFYFQCLIDPALGIFILICLQIPLMGAHSIVGRAVVVHADPDDLGRGKMFPSLFWLLYYDLCEIYSDQEP